MRDGQNAAGATGVVAADTPSVLIVDDENSIRTLLGFHLDRFGFRVEMAGSGEDALARLGSDPPDVLLLDLMLPGINGLEVLREVHKTMPEIPVVVLTAHGSIEVAVEAMKLGARDFISKPFDIERLSVAVNNAVEIKRLALEVRSLKSELASRHLFASIIGADTGLARAVEMARRVLASPLTVLLLGESGTGKELFAHAIHHEGPRRERPFVAINCAALPPGLLESELFGHERGAFTGAERLHRGKLEVAQGGSLFLDEIGDMPLELQAKLLRVIQDKAVTRLGGSREIQLDVRIIAATNRDLAACCAQGTFRYDLFYRLSEFPITIPPLRERRCDIALLVAHALSESAKGKRTTVHPDALDALESYDWPGNVRELRNAMRRALLLAAGDEIRIEHLPADVQDSRTLVARHAPLGLAYELLRHLDDVHELPRLDDMERALIRRAVEISGGNLSRVARLLGIGRTTLYRKLHDYDIARD